MQKLNTKITLIAMERNSQNQREQGRNDSAACCYTGRAFM